MRGVIFLSCLLVVIFSGCARNSRDCCLYQSSGRSKPIVTVLPVIDVCKNNNAGWSFSEELTEKIQNKIASSAKCYLLKDRGNLELAQLLSTPNPSEIANSIGDNLGATEFVIVTELLDQTETLLVSDDNQENEIGGNIHMALRVRVLDIRQETPKIILQEVVSQNYGVAKPYLETDYAKYHWGHVGFETTPMGIFHNRMVSELVAHIEGYIGANRS